MRNLSIPRISAVSLSAAFLAVAALVPAGASAKKYSYGPRLDSGAASLSTSDGLGYPGVDTHVPASPEAPNGVIHTSHFGADTAIWNTAVNGRSAAMPRSGQAIRLQLEGCAIRPPGAPTPLNEIHFQTLTPQGNGVKVALSSGAFYLPVCGEGGAGPATVTTYTPVNLCVRKGDYVGFNDEGGFAEPWYRSGVPFQVLGSAKSSQIASFIRGGGTNNGDFFDPTERGTMDGFSTRSGEALLMRVELGTGPDARYVCPGGLKDKPVVLPPLRVSRQTDGINRSRIVAVAIYCRPASGCHGSAELRLGSRGVVGRAGFALKGNATSHLPIRVAPEVLSLIRKNHGVTTRIVARMGRKAFTQLVTIKIL
jgi:hypothetical protein